MYTAIDYLTKAKDWEISSDPRTYSDYPNNYGLRNYTQNGINHDADSGGYHRAFDLYNNKTSNVPSVTDGTVVRAVKRGSFGGEVVIKDKRGYYFVYGHLQRNSIKLKKGDKVKQGDTVGLQGNSNYYDNPMDKHLHIQLLAPNANITQGKWYIEGLELDRYDIKTGEYNPVNEKVHLLVAGHGGIDPGAIGNGTNERDFTRDHIVGRVAKYINAVPGHRAVIYNKKYNMYVDTQRPGGGMYWALKQKFATVTEFHLDAASAAARGGHVIVYSGFAPDKIDLGIRDALQEHVGIRYEHKGHGGISGRNNLLQVNVAAEIGVNYRLVELGFITNTADFKAINDNIEALTKDMAEAITGGTVSAEVSDSNKPAVQPVPDKAADKIDPAAVTPRLIGDWKTNQYGTQYIKAEGTFTVGNTEIMSTKDSPFDSSPLGGYAYPGYKIKYDEIVRVTEGPRKGHVEIGYNQNSGRWYLPYNTWDPYTGEVGNEDWGTFS